MPLLIKGLILRVSLIAFLGLFGARLDLYACMRNLAKHVVFLNFVPMPCAAAATTTIMIWIDRL
jgi:hypothetical protein